MGVNTPLKKSCHSTLICIGFLNAISRRLGVVVWFTNVSMLTFENGDEIQGRSQPFERDGAILKFAKLVTYNNLEN